MSEKDLTYAQGFSDGYQIAMERYQNIIQDIIQELIKGQSAPQYIVVTQEKLDEIKKEQLTK